MPLKSALLLSILAALAIASPADAQPAPGRHATRPDDLSGTSRAQYARLEQSRRDVVERMTAEFSIQLASKETVRVRVLKLADNERRKADQEAARKIGVLQTMIADLEGRLGAMIADQTSETARRAALDVKIEDLRKAVVLLSAAINASVAARSPEDRAALETYRDAIAVTIGSATPRELESIQAFLDGDDSAFAVIDRLTRAKIAARNAATAASNSAELMQLARFQEIRWKRGTSSLKDVVAAWQDAIDADPTAFQPRDSLCAFSYASIVPIDPQTGQPRPPWFASLPLADGVAEAAHQQCMVLANPLKPEARLDLYATMLKFEDDLNKADLSIDTVAQSYAILDRLVDDREVDAAAFTRVVRLSISDSFARSRRIRSTMIIWDERDRPLIVAANAAEAQALEGALGRVRSIRDAMRDPNAVAALVAEEQIASNLATADRLASSKLLTSINHAVERALRRSPTDTTLHDLHAKTLADLFSAQDEKSPVLKTGNLLRRSVKERRWLIAECACTDTFEGLMLEADLERTLFWLAIGLDGANNHEQIALFEEMIRYNRRYIASDRPEYLRNYKRDELGWNYRRLGRIRTVRGDLEQAKADFANALETWADLFKRDPSGPHVEDDYVQALDDLTSAALKVDDVGLALSTLRKSEAYYRAKAAVAGKEGYQEDAADIAKRIERLSSPSTPAPRT